MADTNKGKTFDREQDPAAVAARDLGPRDMSTIDGALGPNWDRWVQHVKAHVPAPPDADDDGYADPATPVVPLLVYGEGPHDYIATDVYAGEVVVRDGNDSTGKAWKFPEESFLTFVAHLHGKKVRADDEDATKGDDPITAARKLAERTNASIEADREATEAARKSGETRTAK